MPGLLQRPGLGQFGLRRRGGSTGAGPGAPARHGGLEIERGDGGLEVLLAARDADAGGLREAELLGGALHEVPERRLAEVVRRHHEPARLRAHVHGEVAPGHCRQLGLVEQRGAQAVAPESPLRRLLLPLPPLQPRRRPEVAPDRHHRRR